MNLNQEQMERLFTKLGAMHSDINTLQREAGDAHSEREELRDDLDKLTRTVSRAIGWGAGAGTVVALGISVLT